MSDLYLTRIASNFSDVAQFLDIHLWAAWYEFEDVLDVFKLRHTFMCE